MTNEMDSRLNVRCDVLHILRQIRLHFNSTKNRPRPLRGGVLFQGLSLAHDERQIYVRVRCPAKRHIVDEVIAYICAIGID